MKKLLMRYSKYLLAIVTITSISVCPAQERPNPSTLRVASINVLANCWYKGYFNLDMVIVLFCKNFCQNTS